MSEQSFILKSETIAPGLQIYVRADTEKQYWYMKANLASGRTLRASLKTTDKNKAINDATQIFEDWKFRDKHRLPLREGGFEDAFVKFSKYIDERLANGYISEPWHKFCRDAVDKKFIPFFKRHDHFNPRYSPIPISQYIPKGAIDRYIDARLKQVKEGRNKHQSGATMINTELGILRQAFKFFVDHNLIAKEALPPVVKPKFVKKRRPHFDLTEWRFLTEEFLPKWVEKPENKTGWNMYVYPRLYHFIMVVGNVGTRTGETLSLQWKNMTFIDKETHEEFTTKDLLSGDDVEYHKYWTFLSVIGKVGEREPQANDITMRYFQWQYRFTRFKDMSDYVFCHQVGKSKGNRFRSFHGSWKRLMEQSGLMFDRKEERQRSLYSIRHTLATFKLDYEDENLLDLAHDLGTSVKMLEKHYLHPSKIQRAKKREARKLRNSV